MVQIIKSNRPESVGETFGKAFSNLGQAGAEAIMSQYQQKQNQSQLDQENQAIFRETGIDLRGINDQKSREEAFKQALMGKQNQAKEERERNDNLNMQELKHRHEKELQEEKFRLEGQKPNPKENESRESHETAQKAFNKMSELVNGNKLGRGSGFKSFFGGETAKQSGKFQSLTGALEALLVDKVNRGTLSNTRFQYITETLLPKPTDSINEIKGKMEGLAEILNLDASALGLEKEEQGMIEMKDKAGNIYDIPFDLQEQARAQGLI